MQPPYHRKRNDNHWIGPEYSTCSSQVVGWALLPVELHDWGCIQKRTQQLTEIKILRDFCPAGKRPDSAKRPTHGPKWQTTESPERDSAVGNSDTAIG